MIHEGNLLFENEKNFQSEEYKWRFYPKFQS